MREKLIRRMSLKLDERRTGKIRRFIGHCNDKEFQDLFHYFHPEISKIDLRGIKVPKRSVFCEDKQTFVNEADRKLKKPEILYRLSMHNQDVSNHNVMQNAANIVSSSKMIILYQIDSLLNVMDPKKVCYNYSIFFRFDAYSLICIYLEYSI